MPRNRISRHCSSCYRFSTSAFLALASLATGPCNRISRHCYCFSSHASLAPRPCSHISRHSLSCYRFPICASPTTHLGPLGHKLVSLDTACLATTSQSPLLWPTFLWLLGHATASLDSIRPVPLHWHSLSSKCFSGHHLAGHSFSQHR